MLKLQSPSSRDVILQWKGDCPVGSYGQSMAVRGQLKGTPLGASHLQMDFAQSPARVCSLKGWEGATSGF